MSSRIVVIGGVAAGMSAASQAKRRQPNSEVIALERGRFVSYGACGMPYNLQDPERQMQDLIVIPARRFRNERGIDVRTRHEVTAIDCGNKKLSVHDLDAGRDYALDYDKLVIATGAAAVRPPFEGLELNGVFLLRDLDDGIRIKQYMNEAAPRRAVVIGGGYIGMEMVHVLTDRGLHVTVLERADQLVPGFHSEIADRVTAELEGRGVEVVTGAEVRGITARTAGLSVETGDGDHHCDMVLVSVGIRPNATLAAEAGIRLGASGAIAVDASMQTNMADVYAAGDCAEAYHRVSGEPVYVPLGTTANKQGKIAGANATGAGERFAGIVGTAAFTVFDLEVGRTGLGQVDIDRLGLDAVTAVSTHSSRGHHYPGAARLTTVVFAERGSRRLLGAQMIGADTVAKRIDVFATALYAGMTVDDVAALDLSYAPPFAPVYDPILIAATVARKELG